jgi:phage baseplate assembly protein W
MQDHFLGRGWQFPPTFVRPGQSPLMLEDAELVRQSMLDILGTVPGQRVMRPDYGSQLADFMFADVSVETLQHLRQSVADALVALEPRIVLDDVVINQDGGALIELDIQYTLRSTNSRQNLVYPFYLQEASA